MKVDWNTPARFVDAARQVMGTIDTDPASNAEAQQTVMAKVFYTEADDGVVQPWSGNVFLNPPYDSRIVLFVHRLLESLDDWSISQAVFMSNSKTDTRWWQAAARRAAAICFHAGRIKSNGSTNSPTCGHTFMYFGSNVDRFAAEFGEFGFVVVGHQLSTLFHEEKEIWT